MIADQTARMYTTIQLAENPRKDEILALYGKIDAATDLQADSSADLASLLTVLTGRQDFQFIASLHFHLPAAIRTESISLPREISEKHFAGRIENLTVGLENFQDLVISYASANPGQLAEFADALVKGGLGDFITVESDLPIQGAEHWCPPGASARLFGKRQAAEQLVGIDDLRAAGLAGDDVIAVIIDQGVNKALFPDNYILRWPPGGSPEHGPELGHGDMVARNIIQCAPNVGIIDVPMVPPRIGDLTSFLSEAVSTYNALLALIRVIERFVPDKSWVFVNAWAVFDRRLESGMAVKYSDNPNHSLNRKMKQIADEFSDAPIDVVLAAGNCGEFCSDSRCGPNDTGPGNSILGVNAHPDVLTVGAVRTDDIWIGSSSQGPGLIAPRKPDVCAPSHFSENDESHNDNLGTSAAAAMAAGVVALLRSSNNPKSTTRRTPAELRDILRTTARKTGAPAGWDGRRGFGTIDAKAAFDSM